MKALDIGAEIERRIEKCLKEQHKDGSWRYCFEGAPLSDAYLIMTLRTFDMHDEALIEKLASRLITLQSENGTWKLYPDEPSGNLSATIESYVALLYSGKVDPNDIKMKKAAAHIRARGGVMKAGLLTRAFLAMNGLYPWPSFPFNPAYLVLLPKWSPFNFYQFSSFGRVHFAPILAAFAHRFSRKAKQAPDISHLLDTGSRTDDDFWPEISALFHDDRKSISALIKKELYKWKQIPRRWLSKADRWIESFILARLEPDGTLLSYASATFFMIYGLHALGYGQRSTVILRAIEGIKSLIWRDECLFHVQNSPSTIWDTALMTYTLLEAGVSKEDPHLQSAANYLLSKQQKVTGDWIVHNPDFQAGGWGFSNSNTRHPDIDDTQTALRVMSAFQDSDEAFQTAFQRGIHWLLSMQNRDGGWPSFEKGVDDYLIALLPIKQIENGALDPSLPDLTGRTLNLFGTVVDTLPTHPETKAAIRWLKARQEKNGSWYGRWGVCYIYGTWAGVTGLVSANVPSSDRTIRRAVKWLSTIQNDDGGWGESCRSDIERQYVPLGGSTVVQTAWAVDAIVAASDQPTDAMDRGIKYLLEHVDSDDPSHTYPVGAGLPGAFYICYHGYPRYWPLLALAHYHRKFS
ncbi:squalene--hopene cyclase [Camelliibacillus cellulosilyticus]|uniref:Squalene--hopene cyclase n=1 Tax=Camelliibacillus cellulosilyticus TaxID=2174486 RepID=A0ABV9GRF3_9BACL